MTITFARDFRGLCAATLFAMTSLAAAGPAQAEAAKAPAETSGAALVAASGLDVVLYSIEQGVRQQLAESGGGHSVETVNYAAAAFDGLELSRAVAEDLDDLPLEIREAARDYYGSSTGLKLVALEKKVQRQLQAMSADASSTIMTEGAKLKGHDERGPMVDALRIDGGSRAISERILHATTYALLLGAGDLKDVQDQAVIDAKISAELAPIWDLIRDFDDLAYAYGFRDASLEELSAFDAFLKSAPGDAFITAAEASIDRRLSDASKEMELRLRTPVKKTKS